VQWHPLRIVRLSVVIACLNAEATIGVQLESLSRQVPPLPGTVGWEVLVCDNGSSDRTLDVVDRYRGRLPLRVVDASQQRGAGPARNAGARAATGSWLAFCDADDEVGPGWVDAMAGALARHRFVAGRFDSARLNGPRALRSRPVDQTAGLQLSSPLVGLPHAGAGNMGIHRDVFLGLGGFDPDVPCLEDTDLSWRAQRAGVELVYVPEAVVHVRLRSTLRGMYAQGLAYGAAHAQLERRHGPLDGPGATSQNAPGAGTPAVAGAAARPGDGPGAGRPGRTSWQRLRGCLTRPPALGRLVWQLGWHVGHRGGEESSPRAAAAPATPSAHR
jgi:cellulose synthase/poly-beta-1,6-N-acetylglucosamine synthase-like glycosyltransferase